MEEADKALWGLELDLDGRVCPGQEEGRRDMCERYG